VHLYAFEFKEIILQSHEKLLHPGIQKMTKLFKESHYFPNCQSLIQNIINCVTWPRQNTETRKCL